MERKLLAKCKELLDLTLAIQKSMEEGNYSRLSDMVEVRQKLIDEIQNIDMMTPETREIIKHVLEIDKDIRIRLASEIDNISERLKGIRKAKNTLRCYHPALLFRNNIHDLTC